MMLLVAVSLCGVYGQEEIERKARNLRSPESFQGELCEKRIHENKSTAVFIVMKVCLKGS